MVYLIKSFRFAAVLLMILFVSSCATRMEKPEDKEDIKEEELIDKITEEIEKGNTVEALIFYESGMEKDQDDLLYSMLLLNAGKTAEAEKVLVSFLEKDENNVQGLYNLSLVYNQKNDSVMEKKLLEKIINIDPDHHDANLSLGSIYASEGAYEKAEGYFKKILAGDEVYRVEARLGYGFILMKQEKMKEALEQYDIVIEKDPDNMIAYIDRGYIKTMQEDYTGAEKDYDEAVRIEPDYLWNYIDRGRARYYRGKYREAAADFSKAIELDNTLFTAYAQRADIYERLGEDDLALEDFKKALELRSDYYSGYVPAALQFFRAEDWGNAADYFLKAYSRDKSPELMLLGAASLIKNNEKSKAEKLISDKRNTIPEENILYHISRLYIDKNYETIAVQRIHDQKSVFERQRGLFYLAVYYDCFGKNVLSENFYSDIVNSNFPPDTLEYKISSWKISGRG